MLERLRRQGREGRTSLSMVSFVLSLVAALVLGLTSWVPRVLARDVGITDVQPGLLSVAQNARGVQSLGAGLTVGLYERGFRLSRGTTVLADTVTRGAPVVAMKGGLVEHEGHPSERITSALVDVSIDAVTRDGDAVTYSGVVSGPGEALPLRISFEPLAGRIRMDVRVRGADAVALSLDWRPATTGIAPALPERNLKSRAYWVDPTVVQQPAFTWILGTDVSIGPVSVPRAVDLRQDGRIALHVWSPRAVVTVTDTPRQPVSDS
ncbi:hypothetical protein KC207_01230 [Phycicoccus sp. BSK3Z-2]|uniref:Uncharacterized protein n=1 Tax=Phycicoccus avicenniae TaxID=2828860 RepID=A0A941D5F9_9MICO|nr:hypothetical protein [Phycicoccus avicenniae]MBR7741913.1 hypothetical protein [Phycicoccus avicenniae]